MTFTAPNTKAISINLLESNVDPLKVANGVYITLHGHYYQPPRENPYLDTIERQPSAYPFHDWNERIHHECYRPNAFARILNERGEVVGIVNNFEYLSFNIGPTLMSWLQMYDIEVYQRIIEADQKSCQRLNGHGNAIAQVYNHIILPLANQRDKTTQIRWGKEDFKRRCSRDPEGMWLAETAVDYATIETLINEGIKFTILAPSQAQRCRPFSTELDPEPEWLAVGGAQIDPTRPYRCFIKDGRYIDIFFYDGPISRDMGFNDVLSQCDHLVGRISQAIKGDHRPSQLISAATDGETFGHHKAGTEKCLAYAFTNDFPKRGWTVTNYAHYLSICPPKWEVELKPVTAWSCSHGVERWQDDCGCGGGGTWHQKWRKPLRNALNWLRDQLSEIYEEYGKQLFKDPWLARDEYVQVILERSPETITEFFTRHQNAPFTDAEKIDALRLLEMQRHTLLMYTSCGWFFDELSRPEGTQILRYAARALELAGDIAGIHLESDFVRHLKLSLSNVDIFGHGGEVYRQLVLPAQISFKQVAAHYAINSVFATYQSQQRVYCYDAEQLDYQKHQIGSLTLAVGQVRLTSEITWESHHYVFSVLHMGGWDFHCCIQPFSGRLGYTQMKEQLFASLKQASVAKMIIEMSQLFGNQSFDLQHLFAEERHRIMQQVTDDTKKRLDQLYTQVYRDNYGILVAFHRDELPVPQELQVAAEIAISYRCLKTIAAVEQVTDDPQMIGTHLVELSAIAAEANHLRCNLRIPEAKKTLERLVLQLLWNILHDEDPTHLEVKIQLISQIIAVGHELHLGVSLAQAQEVYYNRLLDEIVPFCVGEKAIQNNHSYCRWTPSQILPLLGLGQKLDVDVSAWL